MRSVAERWLKEHLDHQPHRDQPVNEYARFLLKRIKDRRVRKVSKKWLRGAFDEWLRKTDRLV